MIPRFVERLLNDQPPIIEGDGLQTRRLTFVGDTVQGTVQAIEKDEIAGEIFNIGSEEEMTIKDLATLVITIMDRKDKIKPVHKPPRPGDIKRSNLSIEKAKRILGFHPQTRLKEGIRRYVKWRKES